MTETNHRGTFVWFELMTTDVAGAKAFYSAVVGFGTQVFGPDGGKPYTMWVGARGPIGGVDLLPEQAKAMGAPPHWMGYLAVDDVDASAALVRELGGTIFVEPFDIPTVGRMAICADPQRAAFAIFRGEGTMPGHDGLAANGEVGWRELATSDREAALAFYGRLVGWVKQDAMQMGPDMVYQMFGRAGEGAQGGVFTLTPAMPMPPCWSYYIRVDDFDGAVARIPALGGKIVNGPMDVPGDDRVIQAMDPQGAMFALVGRRAKTA